MQRFTVGFALAAAVAFGASTAAAYTCPALVKQLNAQLPKVADAGKRAEAEKLTKECEALHKEGKHNESVDKCMAAAKLAGITLTMSQAAQEKYDALHKK